MKYYVALKKPNGWYHFKGKVPPRVRQRQIEHTQCEFVKRRLKLCERCPTEGAVCHVIEEATGRKFCPVLFHDLVRPDWRVEDLV